ncbi:PREDICTED: atrophin-1-like [Chrysochloris asiatica]|uniref:Ras association domain-containing protein 7 n=1 Tax=Chrysochloris asiatica TaxID=185453 RepID=A0A9B0UDT0_CHRAS|nr:PREDICTED: atrophin-1-like [Chrysochloris asiatica]
MLFGLAAMELKVWVDGIQRVVCGVSEQTTCQEVVIALAQAIGQTGRFVLVQRLREKERQMLPQECPVGAQATCGQFASDVQFVLRRTGPSLAGRPSSDSCPPPERCPVRASLPPKPRPVLGREPCKALSVGHPELVLSHGVPDPAATVMSVPGCCTDLQGLEQRVQRNAAELGQEAFWEQELRREQAREREGQARLQALSAATSEHAARLQALDAQARALEAELQLAEEAPGSPSSATERLRQDLAAQERHSMEVQGSLVLVSRALQAAEHALQAQAQELEELNRELRQCNLQQFIQQAGAALPPTPRPERAPPSTQDLLPPARQGLLLGAPLSPILVPSLSPEVAPMRQNSWSLHPSGSRNVGIRAGGATDGVHLPVTAGPPTSTLTHLEGGFYALSYTVWTEEDTAVMFPFPTLCTSKPPCFEVDTGPLPSLLPALARPLGPPVAARPHARVTEGPGQSRSPGTDQPLSHAQWVRSSAVCSGQGLPCTWRAGRRVSQAGGGAVPILPGPQLASKPPMPGSIPGAPLEERTRGCTPARRPRTPLLVTCDPDAGPSPGSAQLLQWPRPPSRPGPPRPGPRARPLSSPRVQPVCKYSSHTANGRSSRARPARPQPVGGQWGRDLASCPAPSRCGPSRVRPARSFLHVGLREAAATCRAGLRGAGSGAAGRGLPSLASVVQPSPGHVPGGGPPGFPVGPRAVPSPPRYPRTTWRIPPPIPAGGPPLSDGSGRT